MSLSQTQQRRAVAEVLGIQLDLPDLGGIAAPYDWRDDEIRHLKDQLSKATAVTRTHNQRAPIKAAEQRKIDFYWPKPVDAETDEAQNIIHMIPALNDSGYTDHSPSNVFKGSATLHTLIGTWNGRGFVSLRVEGEDVVLRYSGKDRTYQHYDGMVVDVHPDIKQQFIEKLRVWTEGEQACKEYLEQKAAR